MRLWGMRRRRDEEGDEAMEEGGLAATSCLRARTTA